MAFATMHLDTAGCPLADTDTLPYPRLTVEVYRNPEEYDRGATTRKEWQFIGSTPERDESKSVPRGHKEGVFLAGEARGGNQSGVCASGGESSAPS